MTRAVSGNIGCGYVYLNMSSSKYGSFTVVIFGSKYFYPLVLLGDFFLTEELSSIVTVTPSVNSKICM